LFTIGRSSENIIYYSEISQTYGVEICYRMTKVTSVPLLDEWQIGLQELNSLWMAKPTSYPQMITGTHFMVCININTWKFNFLIFFTKLLITIEPLALMNIRWLKRFQWRCMVGGISQETQSYNIYLQQLWKWTRYSM